MKYWSAPETVAAPFVPIGEVRSLLSYSQTPISNGRAKF